MQRGSVNAAIAESLDRRATRVNRFNCVLGTPLAAEVVRDIVGKGGFTNHIMRCVDGELAGDELAQAGILSLRARRRCNKAMRPSSRKAGR
mgnify:CR=1 FL=1